VDGYPAPHLHTHVVVFNMTQAEDQIRSLDTRELFRVQAMSTAVYQAELAHRLRALGYELEHGKNHSMEIRGYTQAYRDAASARSFQITNQMEEKGIAGAEAAERIAHQTRESKKVWDPEELKAAHKQEAARYGNEPEQFVAAARARSLEQEMRPEQRLRVAHESITFARHRLSERTAVFDEYEVVRDSLRWGLGRLCLADVEQAFAARQNERREFLSVDHYRRSAPGQRFTTAGIIQLERETIERVQEGLGAVAPLALHLDRRQFERKYGRALNEEQQELVWNVLSSRDRIVGVQGGAGTGKTTALGPLRELAETNGYVTRGLAPTSGAARDLAEAGLVSETLQAHLMRRETNEGVKGVRRVYFLDESSLASTRHIHDFLARLGPEDRVILIGDTRQHQSVEAGRIFEELQQAGMATYRLDRIVRQRNPEIKVVVEHLAHGDVTTGIWLLEQQGRVREVEHRTARFQAIAEAYAEAPHSTLVVSPDNESRKEINTAIRSALREKGVLGENTKESLHVLIPRQDLTGADRERASAYHIGNVVRYGRANRTAGVELGEYATVVAIDYEQNLLTVVPQSDGRQVTYNPKRLSGVQVYEREERRFAIGDRVQFTSPWREQHLGNRDIGTITALDTRGNITVTLDRTGRQISWNLSQRPHLDYGYAMTSYSAQGATVDRVLVQIDTQDSSTRQLVDKTLAYVALSRPRHDMQIYTDSIERLAPALSREVAKPKALSPAEIEQYREPAVAAYGL
jgi:AAA domain/TrwC relaxase